MVEECNAVTERRLDIGHRYKLLSIVAAVCLTVSAVWLVVMSSLEFLRCVW